MHFAYTAEEEAFREEVRAFIRERMTPEVVERLGLLNSPARREFMRAVGERGWLAIGWPEEYGGSPGSRMMRIILNEELAAVGAPNIGISVLSVAQAIMTYGSDDQRKEFLPGILRSEILFAFGYTEPHAGSDLAALRTSAVLDGDEYVVNGVKKFITPAHYADYMWTAVRTDPDAERHAGISLLCIPLDSPGIDIHALHSLGEWRTNEVHLRDVRVPERLLVGGVNNGWRILTSALADERLYPFAPLRRSLNTLIGWATDADDKGQRPSDDPLVRHSVARLAAKVDAAESLFMRQVTAIVAERESGAEAAMNKIANTELDREIHNCALSLLGEPGLLHSSVAGAPCGGVFELDYRVAVVGPIAGGSNEIQRNILAKRLIGRQRPTS